MTDLQRWYRLQRTHRRGARQGRAMADVVIGFGEASKSEWWVDSNDATLVNRGSEVADAITLTEPADVSPIADSRTLF